MTRPSIASTPAEGAPPEGTSEQPASALPMATREAILAVQDVVYEYHDVPEWGVRIKVRSLTATDRDRYDAESMALQQAAAGKLPPGTVAAPDPIAALENFRARRVAKAIVDEEDNLLFTSADIALLGRKNAAVIDRIDDVVTRLSGMDAEAVKRALEALKDGPSGGSGTD